LKSSLAFLRRGRDGQHSNPPRARVWIVSLGNVGIGTASTLCAKSSCLALDYSSMDSVPKSKMVCNTKKWHTKMEECDSGMP
jgi:hypothetical protein